MRPSAGSWVSGISRDLVAPLAVLVTIAIAVCVSAQTAPTPPPPPGAPPASASDLAAVLTPKDNDPPAVKRFKETGKNPYHKDAKAIAEGFKLARALACTHCHGESLGGLIGPSLVNGNWRYMRDGTDKGMFETIYFGTGAGMAAWGKAGSLTEDEILKLIAFVRSKYKGDPKDITWE